MIVCAFLICGDFWTAEVWKEWLAKSNGSGVACALITTNCNSIEKEKIDAWVKEVRDLQINVAVLSSVSSEWGKCSIVTAELDLFDTCAKEFPEYSHYFLVSEKTIPLLSANRLTDFCNSTLKNKTSLWTFENNRMFTKIFKKQVFKDLNVDLYISSQFIVMNAQHYLAIREEARSLCSTSETFFNKLEPCFDPSQGGVAPDELVFASLLLTRLGFDSCHFATEVVVADFDANKTRARVHPPKWASHGLRRLILKAKEGKCLAVRKVRVTPEIFAELREGNVL